MSNIQNLLDMLYQNFISMLYVIPALLIAFPVHELSHALVAYALGDKTAKKMGRLTLNPLKHLDPLGTICIIVFHFGWAKPVPINPNNFKNPKVGMSLTALAGPVSNFILAFVSFLLYGLYGVTAYTVAPQVVSGIVLQFLFTLGSINICLGLFNLIPIPPLDGQKIIGFLLPDSLDDFFNRYGMYFQVILMLLLFTSILSGPLFNLVGVVTGDYEAAVNVIFRTFANITIF